jgi:hypothetical protein
MYLLGRWPVSVTRQVNGDLDHRETIIELAADDDTAAARAPPSSARHDPVSVAIHDSDIAKTVEGVVLEDVLPSVLDERRVV